MKNYQSCELPEIFFGLFFGFYTLTKIVILRALMHENTGHFIALATIWGEFVFQ